MTNKILEKAIGIKDQLISDRRALHRIPEFGVSTPKTVAYVPRVLMKWAYRIAIAAYIVQRTGKLPCFPAAPMLLIQRA